jgi:pimeloyl-ACP methyl ester carboxylesterase
MRKTPLVLFFTFVLLALMSLAVFAQEITFVPFSDDAYGIQGVVPEGWEDVTGTGAYQRHNADTDIALLAIQVIPMKTDALWPLLLPQLGLDSVPESTGTLTTDAFEWTLYRIDIAQSGINVSVDLGTAEQAGSTYLVLLQSLSDEYDTLHESVFTPVIESLGFLETDEDVPYLVEDVTFDNGDITLAGTLTVPDTDGQHPAVVLVTGSGPQNRDEIVVAGFPIFKQIADHLTRNGIAVLRYDDRGIGQSGGEFDSATSFDFAADAMAAIAYLKTRPDINPDQIGVMGHSEGGIIGSIIGANPDSGAAFIISMAGPGVDGKTVLLLQNELIMRAGNATEEQIQIQLDFLSSIFPLIAERDWEAVAELTHQSALAQWETLTEEERATTGVDDAETFAQQQTDSFMQDQAGEWFATFLEYDPAEGWSKTTIPVLGLFGSLDLQVDAEQNAGPMEAALNAAGNKDFTIVTIEGANHLFQAAETGAIEEYGTLPKAFTSEFLPTVTDWILEHVDVQ